MRHQSLLFSSLDCPRLLGTVLYSPQMCRGQKEWHTPSSHVSILLKQIRMLWYDEDTNWQDSWIWMQPFRNRAPMVVLPPMNTSTCTMSWMRFFLVLGSQQSALQNIRSPGFISSFFNVMGRMSYWQLQGYIKGRYLVLLFQLEAEKVLQVVHCLPDQSTAVQEEGGIEVGVRFAQQTLLVRHSDVLAALFDELLPKLVFEFLGPRLFVPVFIDTLFPGGGWATDLFLSLLGWRLLLLLLLLFLFLLLLQVGLTLGSCGSRTGAGFLSLPLGLHSSLFLNLCISLLQQQSLLEQFLLGLKYLIGRDVFTLRAVFNTLDLLHLPLFLVLVPLFLVPLFPLFLVHPDLSLLLLVYLMLFLQQLLVESVLVSRLVVLVGLTHLLLVVHMGLLLHLVLDLLVPVVGLVVLAEELFLLLLPVLLLSQLHLGHAYVPLGRVVEVLLRRRIRIPLLPASSLLAESLDTRPFLLLVAEMVSKVLDLAKDALFEFVVVVLILDEFDLLDLELLLEVLVARVGTGVPAEGEGLLPVALLLYLEHLFVVHLKLQFLQWLFHRAVHKQLTYITIYKIQQSAMSGRQSHSLIRETDEEGMLDLADPLVQQAMLNLGFEEEDLMKQSEDKVRGETVVPVEFQKEKEYYLKMKTAMLGEKRLEHEMLLRQEMDRIGSQRVASRQEDSSQRQQRADEWQQKLREKQVKIMEGMKQRQQQEIEYEVRKAQQVMEIQEKNKVKEGKFEDMKARKEEETRARQREREREETARKTKKRTFEQEQEQEIQETLRKYREQESRQEHTREQVMRDRLSQKTRREQEMNQKMAEIQNKVIQQERENRESARKREQSRLMKQRQIGMKRQEVNRSRVDKSQQKRSQVEKQINWHREQESQSREQKMESMQKRLQRKEEVKQEMLERQAQSLESKRREKERKAEEIGCYLKRQEEGTVARKRELEKASAETAERLRQQQEQKTLESEQKKREQMQHQETVGSQHQKLLQNQYQRGVLLSRELQTQHQQKTLRRHSHLSQIKRKYIKKVLQLEEQQKNLSRLQKRDERHKQDILTRQDQSQARLEQHVQDKQQQAQENRRLQHEISKEKARLLDEYGVNSLSVNSNKSLRLHSQPSEAHSVASVTRTPKAISKQTLGTPVSRSKESNKFIRKYNQPAEKTDSRKDVTPKSKQKKVLPFTRLIEEQSERDIDNLGIVEMISSSKAFQHKHSRQIETWRTSLLSQIHRQLDGLDYQQQFLQEKDYKAFLTQTRGQNQKLQTPSSLLL